MAYTSTSNSETQSGNVIVNVFAAIGNWLISIAESNEKSRRVQQLQELSDEQLAKLGLERQDIVRHVFRDFYYV